MENEFNPAGGFFIGWDGPTFRIATGEGLTKAQRQAIWDDPEAYIGMPVEFQHQGVGTHGKPRIPTLKGLRHPNDISEG